MEAINPDWESLPLDIWDLILGKLESSKDFLRFGVVSRNWHALTKNHNRVFDLSRQVPMLIIPNEKEINTWDIFDATNKNKVAKKKLVIPYGKRFSGSSLGWLVAVNEDFSVTLYKPFDKDAVSIKLPALPPPPEDYDPEFIQEFRDDCDFYASKAIISADPLTNPKDCIIAVVLVALELLAFIRPATDTMWNIIDMSPSFTDILFCDRGFQALIYDGSLFHVSNLDDPPNVQVKLVLRSNPLCFERYIVYKRYLVKSLRGELLVVHRYGQYEKSKKRFSTKLALVYEACLEAEEPMWGTIQTLGDAALFLGDNSSICVRASDFVGCRPNHIYFTDDYDAFLYHAKQPYSCDLCVFSLEDRSVVQTYRASSEGLISRMKAQQPIWVAPTLNL